MHTSRERLVQTMERACTSGGNSGLKSRSDKATDRRENPNGLKMCTQTGSPKSDTYIPKHGDKFPLLSSEHPGSSSKGETGSNETLTQCLGNQPGTCHA